MSQTANILWGITASVAAVRSANLARELTSLGKVQAIVTERAKFFFERLDSGATNPATFPESIPVFADHDEWSTWGKLGDPVLHIELRKWADVLVIAPLSADCLARMATGICDNLLLSVARAWDFAKPMILAPAMNTKMWEHPITQSQLESMRSWGARVVSPVVKELACADVGMGALAAPDAIRDAVRLALES